MQASWRCGQELNSRNFRGANSRKNCTDGASQFTAPQWKTLRRIWKLLTGWESSRVYRCQRYVARTCVESIEFTGHSRRPFSPRRHPPLELSRPRPRFDAVEIGEYPVVEVRAHSTRRTSNNFNHCWISVSPRLWLSRLKSPRRPFLIDEATGRSIAVQKGMAVIGTLGILSRAKARGHIGPISPLLVQLRHELDFYVSDKLREAFLRSVGE
jgi:hypothetical protein